MLRRLYHEQPASFEFTPANLAWAEGQISKYPEGRQASAVIPLLWRAQEQTGWLSKPALEYVADMLGMPYIRVLEVATFYFMFQLAPVGTVAHIQVCGTTTCMICGSGDIISVCKDKISPKPHTVSADGRFSWEEVECLGACANAPMAQIGKDYYEDLTAGTFSKLLDDMALGQVPLPGSQTGRYSSEPAGGPVVLADYKGTGAQYNGSVQLAVDIGDTIKRIDGTEVPLLTPWISKGGPKSTPPKPAAPAKSAVQQAAEAKKAEPKPAANKPADVTGVAKQEAVATSVGTPIAQMKPSTLNAPRETGADDLKKIKGVGPKLEQLLHSLGFFHFDQVAKWSAQEVAWVDENLEGFKGRVSRDNWVDQARILAEGGETEFSKRAKY